jgi:beta-glucosidase
MSVGIRGNGVGPEREGRDAQSASHRSPHGRARSRDAILPNVTELAFPDGFLWGTATAAHQVEGDNTNSDWWEFENRPDSPCHEPSGSAIEHYKRYTRDIALLAKLGFNTYRFSVEWPRIEPSEGEFDVTQLDHYRRVVEAVRKAKLTPMVTLNHFTLPLWVAKQGGWLAPTTPALFERFTRKVVEALGDNVGWYCTTNEPGMVALGGYMSGFIFPPGVTGLANWKQAISTLREAHRRARGVIKELRPAARVGQAHAMHEWEANAGGVPVMNYLRRMNEDLFLEESLEDDFVGVQTYTRMSVELPRLAGLAIGPALAVPALETRLARYARHRQKSGPMAEELARSGVRLTQNGWEYRPRAVAAAVRRAAAMLPGKPIVVTEHGIATADDAERVSFIVEGLTALHAAIADGVPLVGYTHWSAFDNFEWGQGYQMQFGLIGVDRATQERTIKPSARMLGGIGRANKMAVPSPQ